MRHSFLFPPSRTWLLDPDRPVSRRLSTRWNGCGLRCCLDTSKSHVGRETHERKCQKHPKRYLVTDVMVTTRLPSAVVTAHDQTCGVHVIFIRHLEPFMSIYRRGGAVDGLFNMKMTSEMNIHVMAV